MKKVNRKFLEEQVKLALTEQEQEQQTGCVPVNEDPGFWSWQMLFSLFFGSPESYKIIAKDLGRKFTWGSSAGSQYLEAASFAKLKSPEKYIFRFLEPVKADGLTYVGSVKFREEIFESFYKVIKFYAQKFSKVNLKAKGTTLGFGEESLEQLVEEFIEKVEEVEERYGLDDPEAGGWAFLKVIGVNVDTEAANAGRHLQTTKAGLENKAKNMRKFLSTPRSVPEIEKYLEGLVMQGIGDIYFGPKIRSFVDIYNYVRSNQKAGGLLNMMNAAAYQKKIKETPTFAAYADVIGSLALLVTTGGAASAGTKAAVKVGARGALARGIAKTAQVTGMPRKAALALIGGLEKRILAKVESSILQTAAKVSTGSAKLATKVAFALPRFLAETSMTMGLVTDKMNFQLGKYQKLFVQYENLIKNQKIDKDALPSDSDTIEVFSMLGDTVKAAVASGEEGEKETQDNSQKIEDKKQFLILKAKLEKDLLETFDAIETASYVEFGGLLKECGVPYVELVEEEKEIRRNIIISSFKESDPDKVAKVHMAFIADVSRYVEDLNTYHEALKKKTQELQSKTSDLGQGFSDLDKIKGNIGIEKPSFISSGESQATQAATTQAPTIDTPTDVAEPQTSFGSNEKTSDEILRDLEAALSKIQESQDSDAISVNIGYKDAIEFAKGNKDFSPEKTKANIDKIIALIQSKGKKANITPVASLTDQPEGVDKSKFEDFSKSINSHIQTKKVSTARKAATAKATQTTQPAAGGVVDQLSSKDELIVIGDSNSRPLAKRWYGVGVGGSIEGENKALVFHMHKGKLVAPSIGSAMVSKIYEYVQKFFAQKGENYKPKVAILHMGYNGVSYSLDPYKKTIDFLKSKGVSDIRVIELKIDPKKRPKMAQQAKVLNDQLREIPGIKFIANPGINGSDGYHFTNYGAIYSAAMSGVTASNDIQPPSTGTTTQTRKELPPANSIQQNFSGPEANGAKLDKIIADAFYKEAARMELSPEEFDRYSQALSSIESGGHKGSTKRYTFQNRFGYIGKYQIGSADYYREELARLKQKYNIPDNIIPAGTQKGKGGLSILGKDEFVNLMKSPEGFQLQELLYAAFQAGNYTGWVKGIDKLTYNREDRLGIAATAHNAGGPAVSQYLIHRANYNKTQDPKYLMRMWAVQDGNAFPSENFYRKIVNKTFGSSYPKLPMGKIDILKKFGGHKAYGKNGEEYWNEQFGNKVDIKKYYKKDGTPSGSDGSLVAVGASNIGKPSGTAVIPQASEPAAKSVDLVAAAKEVQSFESLASYVYDILDTQGQNLKGIDQELNDIAGNVDNTNLSSFKKNADTILRNIHKRRLPRIEAEFRRDIAAAGDDREKLELANKKVAYFHRPMFYSTVNVRKLKTMGTSEVSFAFEPGRNRASVNFDGGVEFYKQDYQDGGEMNKFITKLREISNALEILLEKLNEFSRTESDRLRDIQVYQKSLSAFKMVLDKTIPVISDSTETALRRSYATTVLNAALRKL